MSTLVFKATTIDSLMPGEGGFTVPWAMFVGADRQCWLRGTYSVHPQRRGTRDMSVIRDTNGYYIVDVGREDRRLDWKPAGIIYIENGYNIRVSKIVRDSLEIERKVPASSVNTQKRKIRF